MFNTQMNNWKMNASLGIQFDDKAPWDDNIAFWMRKSWHININSKIKKIYEMMNL